MPDYNRNYFVDQKVSAANTKYGINLKRAPASGGMDDYPLGTPDSIYISGGSTQDIYNWKSSQAEVQTALSEIYAALAVYDLEHYVGGRTPGLNLSIPRNQFIDNLVAELRQKHGVKTLYFWSNPAGMQFGSAYSRKSGIARVRYEQGVLFASEPAFTEFEQRLAAYDQNPPASNQAAPMTSGAVSATTGAPPPILPGIGPPLPPGFPPPPLPQFAAQAPVATYATPAQVSSTPAFSPASFLSAFEIAEKRVAESSVTSGDGAFFLAGSSIDLSALRDPANLRSSFVTLGMECLVSCVRYGVSGA
ncbi:MAG TPA: hypothetical protein VFC90_13735 [Planctomycetota bacterium]|nr:hypothetical protein [Planctomycetota bacterium]